MSIQTDIHWSDSSDNPVMGCSSPCELRPTLEQVLECACAFFQKAFPTAAKAAVRKALEKLTKGNNVSAIYQRRADITAHMLKVFRGDEKEQSKLAKKFKAELDTRFVCYAHQLHLKRGEHFTNPGVARVEGHAADFEKPERFPGRVAQAAAYSDLYWKEHPEKPWLNYLPRMIFLSDMGDAMSAEVPFDYLKKEIVDVVSSPRGKQHIWLWLTKQPRRMAEFAKWLKDKHGIAWPDNLVAMTTVTSSKTLARVNQLLAVPARLRGLSIEPLWEDVKIPLKGISWVIVGGQSGPGSQPFDLAWARSIRDQCKKAGVAFFLKQLGKYTICDGKPLTLKCPHGADWSEWPTDLRVRECPAAFSQLRTLRTSKSA